MVLFMLLGNAVLAAPTSVWNCDISNLPMQLRQEFKITFENGEGKLSGWTLLCDTDPCVVSNPVLPTEHPVKWDFVATLKDKVFQSTGTNKATVMSATLTANGSNFLMSTLEFGAAGQEGKPLAFTGACTPVSSTNETF